jgi:hypothetical protein
MDNKLNRRLARLEGLLQGRREAAAAGERTEHDANRLTEDAVIQEAIAGLRIRTQLWLDRQGRWHHNPSREDPRYWQRIAERAAWICRVRQVVMILLDREEVTRAIELFEAGVLQVRSNPGWADRTWDGEIAQAHDWPWVQDEASWIGWLVDQAINAYVGQVRANAPPEPSVLGVLAWLRAVGEELA